MNPTKGTNAFIASTNITGGDKQQGRISETYHHQRMPSVHPIGASTAQMISKDTNLMPSMVVRQQKSHLSSTAAGSGSNYAQNQNNNHDELLTTHELLIKTRSASAATENGASSGRANNHTFDQNGLILPRRVPKQHSQLLAAGLAADQQSSASLTSTIQDLNRELKFNQTTGKDVLDQKSELKRAMEKLAANRRRKEAEQERLNRRSSLELRLEERAQRIARESTTSDANVGGGDGGQSTEANRGILS